MMVKAGQFLYLQVSTEDISGLDIMALKLK